MANVLGIIGSPRKDGNSARLLARVLGAVRGRAETETVHLKDYRIDPCAACHRCETGGGWRDDPAKWPEVYEAMVDAMIRLERALKPHIQKLKV